MNKKVIRLLLMGLMAVSMFFMGACSSEESSKPEKKITIPKPAATQKEQPQVQQKPVTSTIEETPIVAPPAEQSTSEQAPGVPGQPVAAPQKELFNPMKKAGWEVSRLCLNPKAR